MHAKLDIIKTPTAWPIATLNPKLLRMKLRDTMKSFVILLAIAGLAVTNTSDQKKNRQRDLLTSDLDTVSSYNPSNGHANHFSSSGTKTSEANDYLADPLVSAYLFGLKYDQHFHKENANNIVSKRATLSPAGLVSGVNVLPILAHSKTKRFAPRRRLDGTSGRNVQISKLQPTPKTTHLSSTTVLPPNTFSRPLTTGQRRVASVFPKPSLIKTKGSFNLFPKVSGSIIYEI